ncbi:DoxX family protein [Curtobacterium sp. RRHDQ10]|uniref:DoxX family protein n=1 Tax=Curtobacterium phyllosphaerae TaxID=3413379 RepID=UPI003BEFFCD7
MGRSARARRASTIAGRIALLLGASGVLHMVRPGTFVRIVPRGLPARTTTYASGVAELAIAAGLLVPRTRRRAGLAAAALFLAVFPANVKMARDLLDNPRSPRPLRIVALLRLPLQLPLLAWALRIARHARP